MAASTAKKRKAVTRDVPLVEEPAAVLELGNGLTDDAVSDSEDGGIIFSGDEDEAFDTSDELDSDEIPSEDENEEGLTKPNGTGAIGKLPNGTISALDEDDDKPNYTVTEDAHGNPRYVYREIDPVYDSDDSEAPETTNTIGNIPLSFYDSYPHIGYDLDGRKVMRPAKGAALDSLLDSIELPKGWTGLTDPATGKPLQLNQDELSVLKRLTRNEVPEEGYDPYPETVEYFTSKLEQMPLSAAPEPKRRFVPSKHEATRVMKIVKAIREGRIKPYKPAVEDEEEEIENLNYDLWADEAPRPDHPMNMPAPKLPPPGYEESYHPPPEYLPDESERRAWEDLDEEDRDKDFLPTSHDALRKVPGYEKFVKEKFERCLDLYLAPRVRRSKLNIDPESLLPKLPSPEELRPFPSQCKTVLRGHKGRVRSVAIDPRGELVASGGDDGTLKIWSLDTGHEQWSVKLADQEPVNVVRWRPQRDSLVLAAAAGENVYLVSPDLALAVNDGGEMDRQGADLLNAGWTLTDSNNATTTTGKESPAKWVRPEPRLQDKGVIVQISLRSSVKVISWHRRGEYFSTVSPRGQSSAVAIHTLSKHQTQLPFRRLRGRAEAAHFHPSKPVFFVATQTMIRSYDLARQELLKILRPGARWISNFDVHPGGDNLLVGAYDKRLLWMDMDLSDKPYKTLRYHTKAVRNARFHQGGYPLFADASDDGSLQIFHGKVVNDMMENAKIVPLKVLKGHEVVNGLGVLDLDWHPTEPWVVSAGADGTCRIWR